MTLSPQHQATLQLIGRVLLAAIFIEELMRPKPATEAASAVTRTSGALYASVAPAGATVSACYFEYGTTTAYGKSVECASLELDCSERVLMTHSGVRGSQLRQRCGIEIGQDTNVIRGC